MKFIQNLSEIVNRKLIPLTKRRFCTSKMACSKYEYVKDFEIDDRIIPNVWIVVRIDGKSFHKFSKTHGFEKPNDRNALDLMSYSAVQVMEEFREIILSFGQSDEYSFIFHKSCDLYNRRQSKIMSCVNSLFTSAYVAYWNEFLPKTPLQCLPSFDARCVLYPSDQNLKDYLSWRQADVHINNLYNTCFWNLVQKSGLTNTQAEEKLRGTFSSDKNELLFSDYGINYNNLDPMFRKGTILLRKQVKIPGSSGKTKQLIIPFYEDMIREDFWKRNDELLERGQSKFYAMDESNVPGLVQKQIMKVPR